MLYLRNMIDNHRILTALLVIYFCLFLGLYPAVAGFWKRVAQLLGIALGIASAIDILQKALNTLNKRIEPLQKEITRLDKLRTQLWKQYEEASAEMKVWKRRVKSAQRAYDAAVTAYNEAVSAEKAAGRSYRAAAHYAKTARRAYIDHVQACYECRGSALCPIGQNLQAAWSSWENEKRRAKIAWDNAIAQVKSAKSAKEAAYRILFHARRMFGDAMTRANNALAQYRALGKEIEKLRAELAPLMVQKAVKEAELAKALGDLAKARRKLDEAARDYPKEWEEAMKDPTFRQDIENLSNY